MEKIIIYKIREDGVFGEDVELEVKDAQKSPIPIGHTRSSPHPIPDNHYAVMNNGWQYVSGETPALPVPFVDHAGNVRRERDRLLAETDWIVIKNLETNQNIPGVWEVYRQALRDIPSQEGFPQEVIWPVKP